VGAAEDERPVYRNLEQLARGLAARGDGAPTRLTGLRGAARGVVGARLVQACPDRPVLFLAPTAKRADRLLQDLRVALGEWNGQEAEDEPRIVPYPRHDTVPYDRFSPQPFVVAQRMDVLWRLLDAGERTARGERAPVVVAPWTALAMRVPSRELVRTRSVSLEVGLEADRDELVERLIAAGYARMPMVEERGEIAVRGGVLDVFPPQRDKPVRLELLGDEIESIREFDPASQRSLRTLPFATAAPARELLFDRDHVIERGDELRHLARAEGVPDRTVDELIDALLRGHVPPGAESLAPVLQPGLESVLDFLPDDALVVLDDAKAGRERLLHHHEEILENHEAAAAADRLASPPAALFEDPDEIARRLDARGPVRLERLDVEGERGAHFPLRCKSHEALRRDLARARTDDEPLAPLVTALERFADEKQRIVLATRQLSSAERLRELLAEYGVASASEYRPGPAWRWSRPGKIEVRVAPLSEGFTLPLDRLVVVTEEEIFGPREKRRARTRWREGQAVEGIAQLKPGDHVVHTEHGIGVYRGLVQLTAAKVTDEFLRLEYEGGDKLFLPIHRLNLISRYVGADGQAPRLDRMGGSTWQKAKRGVRKAIQEMAEQLLAVHAAREVAPGHAYPPRDRQLEEFEARFPYEETPDQLAAIEDVLSDLGQAKPMDRLVCGDVGYGKTEVAVRAAFQVALSGRQAAVLVPTTVLAQQHEETFRKRFDGVPVAIETLSRFRAPKDVKKVLEGLVDGTVDVVIGTHRILQKDVRFRDLGLLVVDEEHRFGVAHKERIKQLKKTVDVLTLTATPIPRTLQQAFTGIRDLSVIDTPPADRLAVRTQVCKFGEGLVREAILRELRRGGQVFFLHNRVQTIDAIAEMLRRVVPEAKVLIGHGQMRERELEEVMLAFYHGEADVLLCTTIIESGLDVPRANTILINRADRLGLAQLYQLRGRVGRSDRRAYAYLMIPGADAITDDAERRLDAIQDLSELGSGFRLANMDLEIRGAGNLLGTEQSGHMAAVGFETYMEMLEETVEEMRGNVREIEVDPEIRLPVAARLPEDYVPDVGQRLVLYKRLSSAHENAEVDRIRDEILDRYGPMPDETENLLHVIRIKAAARKLGIAAIDFAQGDLVVTAGEHTRIDPQRLVNLLQHAGSGMRVTPDHRVYAHVGASDPATVFDAATRVLANLGG
jgi:transcription-repair coupling factor (superfamily II helicase)